MSEKDPKEEKHFGLTGTISKADEKSTVTDVSGGSKTLSELITAYTLVGNRPLLGLQSTAIADTSSITLGLSGGLGLMSPSIMEQEKKINDLMAKLQATIKEKELTKDESDKRNEIIKQLHKERSLQFLLNSVTSQAHEGILLESSDLTKHFLESPTCQSFVMSIDIRRSTELMLKANSPQAFADFISGLCLDLSIIVKNNYGVYDKFTGDGILSFFPEFFSGKDAGYYALKVASQCHKAFESHYNIGVST